MSEPSRSLPPRPSLEQQQKLAKELLKALRAGDVEARERIRQHLPDKQVFTLADAQFAIAREYGFESWRALKAHIDILAGGLPTPVLDELQRAFHVGDTKTVRELVERHPAARAMIDAPHFPFDSPALVHVAGTGDLAMVDVLLELGADPNRRSDWWAGGFHALHSARGAVADRLLEAGAVPDACAAANLDRPELLERILDADPSRVHERGGDGQTPLHFACSREVVDLLLERGADPDARDVDHRSTPAQWMASQTLSPPATVCHARGAGPNGPVGLGRTARNAGPTGPPRILPEPRPYEHHGGSPPLQPNLESAECRLPLP
jgi:ankyrin repeat protein